MLQENFNHEKASKSLKKLIFEKGHNNTSLAKKAGISEAAVRNLVSKDLPFNPKADTLLALADALGVEIDDILFPNE